MTVDGHIWSYITSSVWLMVEVKQLETLFAFAPTAIGHATTLQIVMN